MLQIAVFLVLALAIAPITAQDLTEGEIIGISIGAVAGFVIIVVLMLCCCWMFLCQTPEPQPQLPLVVRPPPQLPPPQFPPINIVNPAQVYPQPSIYSGYGNAFGGSSLFGGGPPFSSSFPYGGSSYPSFPSSTPAIGYY